MRAQWIAEAFYQEGVELWGWCGFDRLKDMLLPCRNRSKLPKEACTVLCALFPYRSPVARRNVSRYAVPPDYHAIVLPLLERVAQRLRKTFPEHSFVAFADNSPIPEVYAASVCGLGCVGDHGLLIHPEYGSWVFIGELVTDLFLPEIHREASGCLHCGACIKSCPSQALQSSGFNREQCLSHLTQKKGALSEKEEALIQKGTLVWGCDLCQEHCPMNRGVKRRGMEAFQRDLLPVVRLGQVGSLEGRAFCWRPPSVLERNLRLLERNERKSNP